MVIEQFGNVFSFADDTCAMVFECAKCGADTECEQFFTTLQTGQTLQEVKVDGQTYIEFVKKFIKAMFDSVDVLEKAGVVHRDLKIENFLVKTDGSIVMADFGLSREQNDNVINQYLIDLRTLLCAGPEARVRADAANDYFQIAWTLQENLYLHLTKDKPKENVFENAAKILLDEHEVWALTMNIIFKRLQRLIVYFTDFGKRGLYSKILDNILRNELKMKKSKKSELSDMIETRQTQVGHNELEKIDGDITECKTFLKKSQEFKKLKDDDVKKLDMKALPEEEKTYFNLLKALLKQRRTLFKEMEKELRDWCLNK